MLRLERRTPGVLRSVSCPQLSIPA
jgi:hypothetical protein